MGFLKNINAWTNKTKAQRAKVKAKATDFVQRRALIVLKDAMMVSPQYSGNYAFNWKLVYGMNAEDMDSFSNKYKGKPWNAVRRRQAGDMEAINDNFRLEAMDAKDPVAGIKWNHKIRLVNNAPVAKLLDAGEVKLRPENLIAAPQGVIAYLNMKYK